MTLDGMYCIWLFDHHPPRRWAFDGRTVILSTAEYRAVHEHARAKWGDLAERCVPEAQCAEECKATGPTLPCDPKACPLAQAAGQMVVEVAYPVEMAEPGVHGRIECIE